MESHHDSTIDRRSFMKTSAAAAVLGSAVAAGSTASANLDDGLIHRNERPDRMTYRKLGKTNFMCSRLVFGCGAALMGGKAVNLLERAFDQGINHYDVGFDDYYKGSEKNLAAFLNRRREEVWVTSKAFVRADFSPKDAAEYWSRQLDLSLERMQIDHVDAYYLMAVDNPEAVKSEALHVAFLKAKEAGKVSHYGISTHKRAKDCLEAAIETGWYSQAMIAITPSGWYDWDSKRLLDGTPPMKELRPVLDRAREAGIGVIGMKAARFIAPKGALGQGETTSFDKEYHERLLNASLSPFQRSFAYVLENGLDVVNADMQVFEHLEENLVAARTAHEYFA